MTLYIIIEQKYIVSKIEFLVAKDFSNYRKLQLQDFNLPT